MNKLRCIILLLLTVSCSVATKNGSADDDSIDVIGEIVTDSISKNQDTLTLAHFVDTIIPSTTPVKIVIYAFNDDFETPYVGNNVRDDFYNLLRGEQVNLSKYPHKTLNDSIEIREFMTEINGFTYVGKSEYCYPELPGKIASIVKKEHIRITKSAPVVSGLIILVYEKHGPVLLWQGNDCLNVQGYEFKTGLFDTTDGFSKYRLLYEELVNRKPSSNIYF